MHKLSDTIRKSCYSSAILPFPLLPPVRWKWKQSPQSWWRPADTHRCSKMWVKGSNIISTQPTGAAKTDSLKSTASPTNHPDTAGSRKSKFSSCHQSARSPDCIHIELTSINRLNVEFDLGEMKEGMSVACGDGEAATLTTPNPDLLRNNMHCWTAVTAVTQPHTCTISN